MIPVLFIAIAVSIINLLPVISQWIINPRDREFIGISHFFEDFFLYTSAMAQGAAGKWIYFSHPYTSEVMPPTWYYWPNVFLGHLGSYLNLAPFATYNIAVFIFTAVTVVIWFLIAKKIFPDKWKWVCFILILTQTSFWGARDWWYSPAPLFNRFGSVPMHNLLTIMLLLAFLLSDQKQRLKIIFLSVTTFGAALLNPIQTGLAVASLVISRGANLFLILPLVLAGLITNSEVNRQPVLVASRIWEIAQQPNVTLLDFALAVGFPLLFFIPGLISFLARPSGLKRAFMFYGLASLALFFSPIPRLLNLPAVRFLHPVSFAFFAIAATEGIRLSSKRIPLVLIFILYILTTAPSLIYQIKQHINPNTNPLLLLKTDYNHVPKPIVDALLFLKNQNSMQVAINDPKTAWEVLIPVFSLKPSFVGHTVHTLYAADKRLLQRKFFDGMETDEAVEFVKNHRIGFIIAGPATILSYDFAKKIYENEAVVIYSISL